MTLKQRLLKLFALAGGLLTAGLAYAVFVNVTGVAIPCVFRLITGLQCPGCGVSRMCLSLLRLDFRAAWQANPALMALSPLGVIVAVDIALRYVKTGKALPCKLTNLMMVFMIGVLLVFGVARNIL